MSSTDQIAAAETPTRQPRILVFDSGLGGLTVLSEIVRLRPGAHIVYAADDAVFPYGRLPEAELVGRVMSLMDGLIPRQRPDIVVIACNTASVCVLAPLRSRWPGTPFVGTVPAIKPAAALSRSRAISILATPGTVAREYTHDLVRSFAEGCEVTLVGAPRLAALAEAELRGQPIADAEIMAEIAPAFVERADRRTDVVVLACTHYPLLLKRLAVLAPWPVSFIDSAAAIARRTDAVLDQHGHGRHVAGGEPGSHTALFTAAERPGDALGAALVTRGFTSIRRFPTLSRAAAGPQGDPAR